MNDHVVLSGIAESPVEKIDALVTPVSNKYIFCRHSFYNRKPFPDFHLMGIGITVIRRTYRRTETVFVGVHKNVGRAAELIAGGGIRNQVPDVLPEQGINISHVLRFLKPDIDGACMCFKSFCPRHVYNSFLNETKPVGCQLLKTDFLDKTIHAYPAVRTGKPICR